MAVTIKYKSLFETMLKYIPQDKLQLVQADILRRADELSNMTMRTVPQMHELDNLVAQSRLIAEYLVEHKCEKCEKCGDSTTFSENMCECCFDAEVDRYYDGGRDEDE